MVAERSVPEALTLIGDVEDPESEAAVEEEEWSEEAWRGRGGGEESS
jgi:hypothetical protein